MASAIHDEHATFEVLRAQLGEMAQAIAEARAAIKPGGDAGAQAVDVGALIGALEARIEAMTGLLGGAAETVPAAAEPETVAEPAPPAKIASVSEPAAAEAPDQHDRVPTVSDVVSQLSRSDDTFVPFGHPSDAPSPITDEDVAMLEAMVEALTAPTPESPPPAELVEPAVEEAAASMPEPVMPEAPAPEASLPEILPPEQEPSPADAFAAPLSPPRAPMMPELDLMSNFAQMEAVPFMPSEVGTPVIFAKSPAPSEPEPEPTPVLETQPESAAVTIEAATELETVAFAPPADPVPAIEPQPEPEAVIVLQPPADVVIEDAVIEPQPQPETLPVDAASVPEPVAFAPPSELDPIEHTPPAAPAPAPEADEPDFDLGDLLFEPEAEADPADFLLGPAPMQPPAARASSPTLDHAPMTPATLVEQPAPAASAPRPHDPLAPLNAMSDEEKIALFS